MHAASRQTPIYFAPQDWGHFIPKQAVENSASLGGVNQFHIDIARVGEGFVNCGLGDFVEHHALGFHLWLEVFKEVGGNGFALAVFVGCEIEHRSVLQFGLQLANNGGATLGQFVIGLETVFNIYRQTFAWKVGNVTNRCANYKVVTKKFGDGFCFCGGLNDDEWLRHDFSSLRGLIVPCQAFPRKPKCGKGLNSLA